MKPHSKKAGSQIVETKALPVSTQKPVYWKQVLVTTFTVYPMILAADQFLNLLFPMEELRQAIAVFFTVTVVASLMVFPVMPLINKFLGPWMRKKRTLIINEQKMKTNTKTKPTKLLDTKKVQLNKSGLNLRYAELGDPLNPSILLLHGVPENLQAWYDVAPRLSENYHVLAVDWPGFGGSDPLASPNEYTSQNFANVIVEFMDSLQISQATLMATDIALLPAFLVGLVHPNRVSKLVVMDGIPFLRPQYSSWELRSFAKKGSILGNALVRWFPRISAQISYVKGFYKGHSIPAEVQEEFSADGRSKSNQEAFLSYFQNFHLGQKYFEHRAQELETPVLVVWGKYDRFINVKLAHEIVQKLPNAKLEIIDNSGHYVHMDKPQELVEVATRFLQKDSLVLSPASHQP